ncbi:I78 family peptidase inhibitor [Stenotrophomonas sp. SY1]|uniref:I78 family peptidase inhibitor n=1 Tax=Stenotrophomonas sp. SY1 TaxID=477235 RepID=UPI001E622FDF|nr:I78 family peptidase inhibitor [Stenotrophomonas sp. SY1]MCD9085255.1 Elastase inhibitor AFLEI Flags: Precursor [Stenotrophomonas sp. SY1]
MIGALSLALALAACNGPAPEEQEQALDQAAQAAQAAASTAEATPPPPASCDASQVQGLVGQTYSDAVQTQAKEDSGASDVRVLKPNQPVTMEFIGERLNIEIDDKNVISGVRCG